MILREKKIKVLKRAKKWTFSKGVSPWILTKNRNFFYLCFSLKLCRKTSFFDIVERKQSFLDQKIEVLRRAKKWSFFKGVSPWSWSKNRSLKRAKTWTFSKGVSPWILSKHQNFSYSLFFTELCEKTSFFVIYEKKTNHFKTK